MQSARVLQNSFIMSKKGILNPPAMKIFETVQKHLASIGYAVHQSPFNIQQLRIICMGIMTIFMQCVYLFCIANTTKEFMDSILMTTAGILVFISNLSTAHKTATIFIFIERISKVVNESKFRRTFSKMYSSNEKYFFQD